MSDPDVRSARNLESDWSGSTNRPQWRAIHPMELGVPGLTTYVPGDTSLMSRDIGHTPVAWLSRVPAVVAEAERSECRSGDRRARLVRGCGEGRGHVPISCCCSPSRFQTAVGHGCCCRVRDLP